jgi:hypothetical protein
MPFANRPTRRSPWIDWTTVVVLLLYGALAFFCWTIPDTTLRKSPIPPAWIQWMVTAGVALFVLYFHAFFRPRESSTFFRMTLLLASPLMLGALLFHCALLVLTPVYLNFPGFTSLAAYGVSAVLFFFTFYLAFTLNGQPATRVFVVVLCHAVIFLGLGQFAQRFLGEAREHFTKKDTVDDFGFPAKPVRTPATSP